MRQDLEGARRAVAVLLVMLVGSMLANVILASFAVRLSSRERVVIVPPTVSKTFWVEAERVSAEYLEQMGYFLAQLTLNVTPQNVDFQSKLLLQYAAPGAYGELRTALASAAERLKRDNATTVFSARDLLVDEAALRVAVRGQLSTFVSDRRVSDVGKAYVMELQYTAGRIYLKTFKETTTHDPLEAKPAPGAPAVGA
jgi:conjugal transfer pilus assembly protein TraE